MHSSIMQKLAAVAAEKTQASVFDKYAGYNKLLAATQTLIPLAQRGFKPFLARQLQQRYKMLPWDLGIAGLGLGGLYAGAKGMQSFSPAILAEKNKIVGQPRQTIPQLSKNQTSFFR